MENILSLTRSSFNFAGLGPAKPKLVQKLANVAVLLHASSASLEVDNIHSKETLGSAFCFKFYILYHFGLSPNFLSATAKESWTARSNRRISAIFAITDSTVKSNIFMEILDFSDILLFELQFLLVVDIVVHCHGIKAVWLMIRSTIKHIAQTLGIWRNITMLIGV